MLGNADTQPDIRAILQDLRKTLDEAYERILKSIDEKDRKHSRLLLHCIAVAVRPLSVGDLAEILTFDFDRAQGLGVLERCRAYVRGLPSSRRSPKLGSAQQSMDNRIPKFHADQRPINPEDTVRNMCAFPSLISIVGSGFGRDRLVQFSHPTVKEFLTSTHLASLTGDLSQLHILPGNAHTILTRACLGLLLQSGDRGVKDSPLAEYAARHWVTHAQFEDVASRVMDGIKSLFDQRKPHFAAWIGLYDIDAVSGRELPSQKGSPLYYAALCGFPHLVQHLAIGNPRLVNELGGSYGLPLVVALCRNHLRVAELLLDHGAKVNEQVRLLGHGANVNPRTVPQQESPLHVVLQEAEFKSEEDRVSILRLLLKRNADVNIQREIDHFTPLHLSSFRGLLEATRLFLDHGANVNQKTCIGWTPLHMASARIFKSSFEDGLPVARLLLERGADVNARSNGQEIPLHFATKNGMLDVARLLLDHGAEVDAVGRGGVTPLLALSQSEWASGEVGADILRLLVERGADVKRYDTSLDLGSDLLGLSK